ncbi:hypothetical protein DAPPUDRAFT_262154 [Daphnia pulex]|uniref:BTB domain-containing protein n=1 Tax=Daphnia pulex TaxID=6669 RepID=E9HMG9_DAPPU|nr:hypothetical protein DAPPUDRAFT_262154 [Daphnia pulex]|eukprot:EFX67074.1 hypothetical protein DAPPUDRAFT_262154 [Daphnia pulex]
MFQHQTEDYLSEPVEIEDVEPLVFREILHFISTGRLSESEMKSTKPFKILKVAANEVMATEAWEKVERDHPKLCLTTLKKIVETG